MFVLLTHYKELRYSRNSVNEHKQKMFLYMYVPILFLPSNCNTPIMDNRYQYEAN